MISDSLLSWVLLLPFIASFLIGMIHLSIKEDNSIHNLYAVIALSFTSLATIIGFGLSDSVITTNKVIDYTLFKWIDIGNFNIDLSLHLDKLGAVMLFIVTFVGTVITIYAVGYMRRDSGFGRFFSYFTLFIGSMLLLVLANNPIIMFIGWELVGVTSYLLIGYYYQNRDNIKAANKAFIANRIGDLGFVGAIALLFATVGEGGMSFEALSHSIIDIDKTLLFIIALLLFAGAVGKSAQIPLFVWLPDAMAGPTPVSALIHAATMVTAGVYMVARFAFLYNEVPNAGLIIAYTGAVSAILAALFASYQNDIKKILAYSTMSQLGYMFIAVGLGAYSSGIFHLFTHAFFKALLFMGAGVLIVLFHQQNLFQLQGRGKNIYSLKVPMLIATFAITGLPPFAGFFSKDAILLQAFGKGEYLLWFLGVTTAFLTAFYMFRFYFVLFAKDPKEITSYKTPSSEMLYPIIILAVGSALAGFLNLPKAYGGTEWFGSMIDLPDRVVHFGFGGEFILDLINIIVVLGGIFMAYHIYMERIKPLPQSIWDKRFYNALYIDKVYEILFVKSLFLISKIFARVVDGVIDGIIMATVYSYNLFGKGVASLQNGSLRWYAMGMLIGICIISLYLLEKFGG